MMGIITGCHVCHRAWTHQDFAEVDRLTPKDAPDCALSLTEVEAAGSAWK